jgi:hypothetical protein
MIIDVIIEDIAAAGVSRNTVPRTLNNMLDVNSAVSMHNLRKQKGTS